MFRYDYYNVELPGDCADSIEDLAYLAIADAEQRARLYCLPAIWYVVRVIGDVGDWVVQFRICRKRRQTALLV